MKYSYRYIMRFNAIHGGLDNEADKHVHTYRMEFLVDQDTTEWTRTEKYLKSCFEKYKNKDLDILCGTHSTLEDIAREIFFEACRSKDFYIRRLEISSSLTTTYILERQKQ